MKTKRPVHPRGENLPRATAFLDQLLRGNPMPSADIKQQAIDAGFNLRVIDNAKRDLGIRSYKVGPQWIWGYPEDVEGGNR